MAEEEEEVEMEIEAVKAVYEDDCLLLDSYPPHLHLRIKPRTAQVSSQQFVEAVIAIRAGPKYPKEPPHIDLLESKGLDEQRKKHLISSIQAKACELSSCLMLVALCEESVEKLSVMNHPEGDCPLCLYPLLSKDKQIETLPFMKLMSCFHCFHSECIIRWWNWIQMEKETNAKNSCSATVRCIGDLRNKKEMHGAVEENMGNCPVCRKVFHVKDLEHVLDLVGSQSSEQSSDRTEVDDNEMLLQCESENLRRQKFEAILKLQEERSGLIEPKRELVVLPGMFLPQPAMLSTSTSSEETTEQEAREPVVHAERSPCSSSGPAERNPSGTSIRSVERNPSGSSNRPAGRNSGGSSNRPTTNKHGNSGMQKQRVRNPRKQATQWTRKDNGTADLK